MFELNTTEGLKERIKNIDSLMIKLGEVPGNILSYDDIHTIQEYLQECKKSIKYNIDYRSGNLIGTKKSVE